MSIYSIKKLLKHIENITYKLYYEYREVCKWG